MKNTNANNGFNIITSITIVLLAIAGIIQTIQLGKMEVKYLQAKDTITDLTYVTNSLAENILELNLELDIQTKMIEQNAENIVILEEALNAKTNSTIGNYDYNYVLRVVAAESRGESLEGQMGVAQCIRETAKATGMTPEQVVKTPNQYADPVSMSAVTDSVREACERVFINGESVTDEPIRYFYSTKGGFVSKWHENRLTYVMTIGNHKFFKAK